MVAPLYLAVLISHSQIEATQKFSPPTSFEECKRLVTAWRNKPAHQVEINGGKQIVIFDGYCVPKGIPLKRSESL